MFSTSTAFSITTCFTEKACVGLYKSVHYVAARCKNSLYEFLGFQCTYLVVGLVVVTIYLLFLQALLVSMDQYLQGLFVLANDPTADVRKLVSTEDIVIMF